MGPTSVIFIIALLIVAGIVAWAGDVLGSILGKRRISLFGLRPRLTSRLVGVLTGVVITIVTILTLALTSHNIQLMLLRMDEIIRENARYREENATLVSENLSLVESNVNLQQANDTLLTTLYEREEAIENLSYDLSTSREELSVVMEEYAVLSEDLETVSEEISEMREESEELRSEVGSLTTERNQLNAEVQTLRNRTAELNSQVDELESTIRQLTGQVTELTGQVETYEVGEVKVRENQQLVAFYIDTQRDISYIYSDLQDKIQGIRLNYVDPETGVHALAMNEIEVTSEQYVQALEAIRAVPSQDAIVIAYAAANVVDDQPVPIRMEVTGNTMVYPEGSLIYSNTYSEPEEGTDQPYRAVLSQFFEDARNHLIDQSSIIPTASGEVMQITVDDLITLSDRLEEVGFPVELRIVALGDIYRTDFLEYGSHFAVTILPATVQETGTDPE